MTSNPDTGLHPIETASRDELTSLQLERLRWSVKHASRVLPCLPGSGDDLDRMLSVVGLSAGQ